MVTAASAHGGSDSLPASAGDVITAVQAAHKGMNITDAQFGARVEDLQKTLDKFKVPEKEQGEFYAVLGPTKPQIAGQ